MKILSDKGSPVSPICYLEVSIFFCWARWGWESIRGLTHVLRGLTLSFPSLCPPLLALWRCLGIRILWEDRRSDDSFRSASEIRECLLNPDSGHVRRLQTSIMVFRTLQVDLEYSIPLHETFHEWEKSLFLLWYNS